MVRTEPREEESSLPNSLVSLARDPRLEPCEVLCWEDKNAYVEHVKGECGLYFHVFVFLPRHFFFFFYFFFFVKSPRFGSCRLTRSCILSSA